MSFLLTNIPFNYFKRNMSCVSYVNRKKSIIPRHNCFSSSKFFKDTEDLLHLNTLTILTEESNRFASINRCMWSDITLVMDAKCYHCKIMGLTNIKQIALAQEYENLQHYLQTREDKGLYSANKQQADRFYKVIKKHKKYPLSIRNDLVKIEKNPNTVAEYWCRIPLKAVRGGIWIGVKTYEPIPVDAKICESKIYIKDKHWFLDLAIKKEIPEKTEYQNVIAIDMGIKHIACSVDMAMNKTRFFGRNLNRVRGHYFWLRRNLGMKKALDTIKKIGKREKRIVNDIIHKISREIVNNALETNAVIILGNIKYLRKRNQRHYRKRMARLLSGFPHYKLTQYIKYKSALAGIKVIEVSEAWTSQTCNRCQKRGKRKTQGLFKCDTCIREDNADRNAAFNIAKRGLVYISKLGISVNMSRTPTFFKMGEATHFSGW